MVSLSRCNGTCRRSYKGTDEATSFIIEMFLYVRIDSFYEKNSDPYDIGIKCNNYDKVTAYKLHNEELNKAITPFFYMLCFSMLDYHGLLITKSTSSLMLISTVLCVCKMVHGIIQQSYLNLANHNFEDYLTTGCKDRYELMCDVNAY